MKAPRYTLCILTRCCTRLFFRILTCDRALCLQFTQNELDAMEMVAVKSRDCYTIAIKVAKSFICVDEIIQEEVNDFQSLSNLNKIYVDGHAYEFCKGLENEILQLVNIELRHSFKLFVSKSSTEMQSDLASFIGRQKVQKWIQNNCTFLRFPKWFQITQCHHNGKRSSSDEGPPAPKVNLDHTHTRFRPCCRVISRVTFYCILCSDLLAMSARTPR